jgi:hypothetical protein
LDVKTVQQLAEEKKVKARGLRGKGAVVVLGKTRAGKV